MHVPEFWCLYFFYFFFKRFFAFFCIGQISHQQYKGLVFYLLFDSPSASNCNGHDDGDDGDADDDADDVDADDVDADDAGVTDVLVTVDVKLSTKKNAAALSKTMPMLKGKQVKD